MFVIDWSDAQVKQLTDFDTAIGKIVDTTSFLAADARLRIYIENDIAKAQEQVNRKYCELQSAQTGYAITEQVCQQAETNSQAWLWGTIVAAFIAWYLVIFILENKIWYCFLFIAFLLSFAIWWFYWAIQQTRKRSERMLAAASLEIERANEALCEAVAQLKDFLLEKTLCLRKVSGFRYTGEERSTG